MQNGAVCRLASMHPCPRCSAPEPKRPAVGNGRAYHAATPMTGVIRGGSCGARRKGTFLVIVLVAFLGYRYLDRVREPAA